jgi:hypothetical protein
MSVVGTQVRRFMLVESARYDDFHIRPYVTNYDGQTAAILREATQGGQFYQPSALDGVASRILQPSTTTHGTAGLINGFSEKRFSFMLEIAESHSQFAGGTRTIITGYTDHLGVVALTGQRHLDPNMRFYLNGIHKIRDSIVPTANGNSIMSNVSDAMQILHSGVNEDPYASMIPTQREYMLRPEDVAANLDSNRNPVYSGFGGGTVLDNRSQLTTPRLSQKANLSPSRYLAKTIDGFKAAEQDVVAYDSTDELYSVVRDKTRERSLSHFNFIHELNNVTSYQQTGWVTYSELTRLLPGLDAAAQVFSANQSRMATDYQPGQGENWNSNTMETISASVIQQIVPSIMSDCLMTEVAFTATNDTIGGQIQVTPSIVQSFTEGLDMTPMISKFIDRVMREVLLDVSKYGELSFSVAVHINMLFDSKITISLAGQPPVFYAVPTFCDALYAPVLSRDQSHVANMAGDIEMMMMNLGGDLTRMAQERHLTPNVNWNDSNVQPPQSNHFSI